MTLKARIAIILREWAHRIDPQPYVETNGNGWTVKTKEGIGLATISAGRSI